MCDALSLPNDCRRTSHQRTEAQIPEQMNGRRTLFCSCGKQMNSKWTVLSIPKPSTIQWLAGWLAGWPGWPTSGKCRIAILRFATNDYKLNLNWINFRRIETKWEWVRHTPPCDRNSETKRKKRTISNWFVKPQPHSHSHTHTYKSAHACFHCSIAKPSITLRKRYVVPFHWRDEVDRRRSSRQHFCTANSLKMRKCVRKKNDDDDEEWKKERECDIKLLMSDSYSVFQPHQIPQERETCPQKRERRHRFSYIFFSSSETSFRSFFLANFSSSIFVYILHAAHQLLHSQHDEVEMWFAQKVPIFDSFVLCAKIHMQTPEFRFIYLLPLPLPLQALRANFYGPKHNWSWTSKNGYVTLRTTNLREWAMNERKYSTRHDTTRPKCHNGR